MAVINLILVIGVAIGMIGVLGSLFSGLLAMSSRSEGASERSNLFMRYRVGFQLLTLVCVVLLLLVNRALF